MGEGWVKDESEEFWQNKCSSQNSGLGSRSFAKIDLVTLYKRVTQINHSPRSFEKSDVSDPLVIRSFALKKRAMR